MSETIDPVTLQVMGNHLRAAAETMAYTLYRTAFSTFVREAEDFTTQITDAAGVAVSWRSILARRGISASPMAAPWR